jgi:hypothetical protein
MKKVIALVLGLVIMSAGAAVAMSPISKSTFTASVDFTGVAGLTYLSVQLNNRSTGAGASAFSFNTNQNVLGMGTSFYAANEYATIFTTWTSGSNGRVLIYTDNTATDASPKYTGTVSTSASAVGLVCNQDTTSTPLALCWRATDVSTGSININYWVDVATMNYAMHLYDSTPGLGRNFYCYEWMKDKSDLPAWYTNNDSYPTVKSFDTNGGWLQYCEGSFGTTPSPDTVYIGANLGAALGGRSYRTSTLRFDMIFD